MRYLQIVRNPNISELCLSIFLNRDIDVERLWVFVGEGIGCAGHPTETTNSQKHRDFLLTLFEESNTFCRVQIIRLAFAVEGVLIGISLTPSVSLWGIYLWRSLCGTYCCTWKNKLSTWMMAILKEAGTKEGNPSMYRLTTSPSVEDAGSKAQFTPLALDILYPPAKTSKFPFIGLDNNHHNSFPWILQQLLECNVAINLPLRMMFSYNSGTVSIYLPSI